MSFTPFQSLTQALLQTAFGDSEDEDHHGDVLPDEPDSGHGSVVQPSIPASYPLPLPPLDMVGFLHISATYDLQKILSTAGDLPSIPLRVPNERPGGESRREKIKSRAAKI